MKWDNGMEPRFALTTHEEHSACLFPEDLDQFLREIDGQYRSYSRDLRAKKQKKLDYLLKEK